MKDVARSVVLGAAMISPALLQSCKGDGATPTPPTDPTGATGSAVTTSSAAPPTTVVRPRTDPTTPATNMPTRGFSGGAGRARVRA